MRISVYITAFNVGEYLSDAINSVLSQKLMPIEIIIIDDCSKDNTRDIIKSFSIKYPEVIKPIYNKKNLGITISRNIALSHCSGEIITYLDGDDIFYPNKLQFEYEILKNNPLIQCVYSNFNYLNENGEITGTFTTSNDEPVTGDIFINTFCRNYNVSSGNNYIYEMYYKSCAKNIGYYDEKIKLWEDWDFRIRMSKKYQYAYCPQINSAYRKLEGGLHNSIPKLHYQWQIKIYNKNKTLIQDLKEEEKSIIKNRVYTKIKPLFILTIKKYLKEKSIIFTLYYSLIFIYTFKTRKAISIAIKTLINY